MNESKPSSGKNKSRFKCPMCGEGRPMRTLAASWSCGTHAVFYDENGEYVEPSYQTGTECDKTIKRKALEAAGWKFGSADEFLGERRMSDSDKLKDKSDYYLVIGPIQKGLDGYPATDRKEWLEDAGWQDVQIIWANPNEHIHYKLGYQAGQKAEREDCAKACEDAAKGTKVELIGIGFAEMLRNRQEEK